MKNKYRNLFLLFGVLAIVVMLCTMDMDYSDIWENLKRVGFWFPVIMLLWFFVYLINTCSWYLIIRDDRKYRVPFWTVCKLSITGFAINYATPGGLMGGDLFRHSVRDDAYLFSLLVLVSFHILIYLPVSCEYLYVNIAHCNRSILPAGYLFLCPWI